MGNIPDRPPSWTKPITYFIFKKLYLFGQSFSDLLIYAGYIIKNSLYFQQNKVIDLSLDVNKDPEISSNKSIFQYIVKSYDLYQQPINYLEFGVFRGESIKWWINNNSHPDSRFWGFDTFTGFPQPWGTLPIGTCDVGGEIPNVQDNRCEFIKGTFQETLPSFLLSFESQNRLIVTLDADLYSSTLYVLNQITPFLKVEDILIFDEFFSIRYPHDGEFRAFLDYLTIAELSYMPIAKHKKGQYAIILKSLQ